uniref:Uncharacterized protein n=1 Tax=Parascaris univalens TaxID=6257 RepID=A0A914ZKB2_PARUN
MKRAILTMSDIGLVIPDSFHKREVIRQHGQYWEELVMLMKCIHSSA